MIVVTYFDEKVDCYVAASHSDVDTFLKRNNLPQTAEFRDNVFYNLGTHGKFEGVDARGNVVGIYDRPMWV